VLWPRLCVCVCVRGKGGAYSPFPREHSSTAHAAQHCSTAQHRAPPPAVHLPTQACRLHARHQLLALQLVSAHRLVCWAGLAVLQDGWMDGWDVWR
jgi:hypothetical protein